jgi:hypothetical protein
MAVSNTSRHLKPLRLHELLAGRAAWTDELWDEVLEYLLGRVGSDDAIYMALLLKAMTGHTGPESPHKIDYLRGSATIPQPCCSVSSTWRVLIWTADLSGRSGCVESRAQTQCHVA